MLRIVFFLCFIVAPLLSFARYQVCSITINSSDEIETFKKFLSTEDFDFVELLPFQVNAKKDYDSHWFNEACRKGYRCDILVVSGHFGGTFFGESGYTLPTELMEEQSCKKTCPGILSNVKEIFLFGCNTLADKSRDRRTYTEYLQVLLDDGMARNIAERVVAARYSPLEAPFYERMNFIFSGSHTVYGFNELSPLGPHIRRPLENYFHSINKTFGSYANYLDSNSYTRIENKELFQNLPRNTFSLNQAGISLSGESRDQKDFFNSKCLLYDETADFSYRMRALQDIFSSGKAGSAFFAVDHFLSHNKRETQEGDGRRIFRSIKNNNSLATDFLSYEKHLDFLPYVRMIYYSLLDRFQWVDPFDLQVLRKKTLLEIIKPADQEAYSSVLLLLRQGQVVPGWLYISKQDLPEDYLKSLWSLLIFEKLRVLASDWQSDILQHCDEQSLRRSLGMCHQALNTLAHIGPKPEISKSVERLLNVEDEGVKYYSLRVLGQTQTSDYETHRRIADFLASDKASLRQEAIEALGFLKTPDPDIQADLVLLLTKADDELAEDILWSLNQMDVTSAAAQKMLFEYITNPDLKLKLFKGAFRIFEASTFFSDTTLSFFYKILENRDQEQLDFLFFVIETLSKNRNIKDIGIHYRFLIFQNEESLSIKKRALKSMSGLTWLHPEVQISFLRYFEDPDPQVRQLAFQALRNIKNLQEKTKRKIRNLSGRVKELQGFFY